MVTNLLLGLIAVLLVALVWYAFKVSKKMDYIFLHLQGINTNTITSVADVPESRTRSDAEEAAICEQGKKKYPLELDD